MQTFSSINAEGIIIDELACKTNKTRAENANILPLRLKDLKNNGLF